MSDLVEFLRARLDEDERVARAATAESWTDEYGEFRSRGGDTYSHVLRHSPTRVLAEVEAKRRIIGEHPINRAEVKEPGKPTYGCETCHYHSEYGVLGSGECDTLRLLALPYADHPDYREEWRP